MKPTWFNRWRTYPKSIAGHILQGVAAGIMVGSGSTELIIGGVSWMVGFWLYQFGSGLRKAINTNHTDTMGLDAFDFIVGLIPAVVITVIIRHMAGWGL